MASLVGAFAASHGPLIIREWERVPPEQKKRMAAAYKELGRRLTAAKPDVLIVVSPDHWSNFFLDNYPAVCIGVGAVNDGARAVDEGLSASHARRPCRICEPSGGRGAAPR